MKLKKKEDQNVDTLVLLRRGIIIPMAHSQPNGLDIGSPVEEVRCFLISSLSEIEKYGILLVQIKTILVV